MLSHYFVDPLFLASSHAPRVLDHTILLLTLLNLLELPAAAVLMSDPLAAPRTAAHQAALSTGFSRQEYCSALHCLTQGSITALTVLMCSKVDPLKPDPATQICKSDSELGPALRRNGKNPPARQETSVQFLDWEDPLEKG